MCNDFSIVNLVRDRKGRGNVMGKIGGIFVGRGEGLAIGFGCESIQSD